MSLKKDGEQHAIISDAAKIEIGLRTFFQQGNFKGFTDTFEDLTWNGAIAGHCGATFNG